MCPLLTEALLRRIRFLIYVIRKIDIAVHLQKLCQSQKQNCEKKYLLGNCFYGQKEGARNASPFPIKQPYLLRYA
ncbi:MAG: hypothetical protein EBT20_13920 [Alphaproteobacteria bacterium]|nr:hypothetical protein [Alphaproteobacteria bacterium]